MKRIVSLALVVCMMALCFVGCSSSKNAKWEGYEDMSFKSYLEKGLKGMAEDEDEDCKIKVTVQNGWEKSDDLDATDLEKGEKAVTYTVLLDYDGDEDDISYHFFMIYADKVLTSAGVGIEQADFADEAGAEQADSMLGQLEEFID